jgi:2-(1,2-epoxy-1,2-dihydrophenyl)acetyl-CoA isomerase
MPSFEMTVEEGVATMLLNRPEAKNALDPEMSRGLEEALREIRDDPSVRAVILTGAGGAFCAGGDVKAMNAGAEDNTAEVRRARLRNGHRTIKLLAELDRPVIAAVDGPAFGAGFSLALFADFVLATPRARFCMAFARIGLIPDYGALYTLPRIVGINRAKDIMLTGREVGADEAREIGIVTEIVEADRLAGRARAIAGALTKASPLAIGMTKSALNSSLSSDLTTVLDMEAANQGIAGASSYAKDSFRRFATREVPLFVWPKPTSGDR